MYFSATFAMPLCGVVLLAFLRPGTARRSISFDLMLHDARQQRNRFTKALDMSAEKREAFLPGGFSMFQRRGWRAHARGAPTSQRPAAERRLAPMPLPAAPPLHAAGVALRAGAVALHEERRETPEDGAAAATPEKAEQDGDEAEPFSRQQVQMVDPMRTSLGRDEELKPYPGPPIPEEPVATPDPRPLFAKISYFTPMHMPSDALEDEYRAWLADGSGDRICLPYYLMSKDDFSHEMDTTGDVLTDEELAALWEKEDEAEGDEAESAEMMKMHVQFVLGHMTIARLPSWEAAQSWAASDPISLRGGYGGGSSLHEWMLSDDPELCVQPTGEVEQGFAVHCVDKPGAAELRAATRNDHLAWLRSSGRVRMAGPLLAKREDRDEPDAGAPEGTLLVVSGDSLADVRAWVNDDPYNAAGLFASVTVAPIGIHHLEEELPL